MRRARVSSGIGLLAALGVVAAAAVTVRAADDNDKVAPSRRTDQEALKAYAPLVGSWRGVGQVERGRARGFWRESADWAWKLTSDSAGLEMTVKTGKYLKAGVLRPGKAPGAFVFEATLADGTSRTFAGAAVGDRKRLVLTADAKAAAGGVRRVSIDPLHDTRVLVLLEAEDPERHTFSRLGEVGYTREGVAFASDESYPLCVVTEGRGTIQVSYKGKTYWVCCTGCRDLFNDHPERVLAEAAAREKAAAKKYVNSGY
jgi:YHS domain-containing protein